uniref:MLO-like protein n=1 Tax=Chenopodium quinoa TaxID=63459 RepID=A0A803LNP1_CHEQI
MENESHGSSSSKNNREEVGDGERMLHQTPTWAVAGVCAFIILISFILEKGLHRIGTWLTKKQKRALYEALDKVKEELMVMGFISLLLTFSQGYIAKICIPSNFADHMLPCELQSRDSGEENRRRLLWNKRRVLVSGGVSHHCRKDQVPLITVDAAHQLHILIFFLAVFHVLYSAATMMLGRLKGCFFRQFYRSVTRADYMTLRNGFITAHIAPGCQFNFQKYIKKSLEDDFIVVVGVSPVLWASFVIFLLLNVKGWHTLFWASILPLMVILAVGTKLQAILTRMALEITERHAVVQGIPLVQGSDEYFWFSRPQFILHLLHFALFQGLGVESFHAQNFCQWVEFGSGWSITFHRIGAMVLCSYSTLPLYALVTQMGSNLKKSIFDELTSKALTKWHMGVKRKQEETTEKSPSTQTLGGSSKSLRNSKRRHSSGPTLHRFMTTGHSTHLPSYVELHVTDSEGDEISKVDDNHGESEMALLSTRKEIKQGDDLFDKPSPN